MTVKENKWRWREKTFEFKFKQRTVKFSYEVLKSVGHCIHMTLLYVCTLCKFPERSLFQQSESNPNIVKSMKSE